MTTANQYVNTDLYAVEELEQHRPLLKKYHDELYEKGALVLPDFVSPKFFPRLLEEAQSISDRAFHKELIGNAYLDDIDENLPVDHARRLTDTTKLGAIAYDLIPEDFIIRKIYEWRPVLKFIESIIDDGPLYPYNCDLGALNLTVMTEGEYLRWHFDQSDFVVSIPLQSAEIGGDFEYVRYIRSKENEEENYEQVKKVFLGERKRVEILKADPGSLVLFRGMNTIHRVSKIMGNRPRLGALLSYVNDPKIGSSDYLKRIRYGRV